MKFDKRAVASLLTTGILAGGVLLSATPAQAATSHSTTTPAAGSPLDPILASIQTAVENTEWQVQNVLGLVECLINFTAPPTCGGAPL